jgi:hypothetical protein
VLGPRPADNAIKNAEHATAGFVGVYWVDQRAEFGGQGIEGEGFHHQFHARSLQIAPRGTRQVKYLDTIVEQDHQAVKRLVRPMLGFKSFRSTAITLADVELMHKIVMETVWSRNVPCRPSSGPETNTVTYMESPDGAPGEAGAIQRVLDIASCTAVER